MIINVRYNFTIRLNFNWNEINHNIKSDQNKVTIYIPHERACGIYIILCVSIYGIYVRI